MQGRKLKILQVASHKNLLRGGAIQMALLAEELKNRGHEVICVFNKDKEVKTADLHTLQPLGKAGLILEFFNMQKLHEIWRFRKWLKSHQFDVIHTHRQQATVFVWLATIGWREENLPIIVAQRGTVYPLRRWSLEKLAYSSRRIKKIIAVAQAVKTALMADKIPAEKIEVIYGGVDEKKFNPEVDGSYIRQEFNIKPDERVITSIGALVAKKGLTDLLQAVTVVAETMPAIKVLIVGSGKREKLIPYLNQSLLKNKVVFTGHRQDIPQIIAASDVVVCAATKGEGLTGALREALAMKKPVVTTAVAGNCELVIHESTGLVVPPAEPGAMAHAILRLLSDRSFAQKLAEQGYQLVRQKCLNSYRTEVMESLYYKLLGHQ